MRYLNLAFYRFAQLTDPMEYRRIFREYCADKPFRGTLLLGHEGLNGMLCGEEKALREFQAFIGAMDAFKDLDYKESWSSGITFPRMLVKVKKEIIPLGIPELDPNKKTGARLKPTELKSWLDENKDVILIDTRNDYEVDYGTFKGAKTFDLKNFRDFPKYLETLPAETKTKPVVMFCTGGIRCEKATAVAMDLGFNDIYQLDGGILKYFEECGDAHYEGNCFVFDRRIAVDAQLKEILPTDNVV